MVRIITDNAPANKPARKKRQTKVQAAEAEALKEARAAADARRLDTRRKVVIGGALMALAEHDADFARLVTIIKSTLKRPADRKLFEDLSNG